jgi:hypothetical protein
MIWRLSIYFLLQIYEDKANLINEELANAFASLLIKLYHWRLSKEQQTMYVNEKPLVRNSLDEMIIEAATKAVIEERVRVAKRLIKKGMPLEEISDVTRLTVDTVERLKKNAKE